MSRFCVHCGKHKMMHGCAPQFVCPGQSKEDVPVTQYKEVLDPDSKEPVSPEELCCAIMFNVMGWLHEQIKKQNPNQPGEVK